MTIAAGGGVVEPGQFNQVTLGVQPSHPFPGQMWVDDQAVSYLYYGGQFNILADAGRTRMLRKASPAAAVSSQTQDTSWFTISGLSIPTAHQVRLALQFSLTGTGSPHSRIGLKINGTTIVNNTTSGQGFVVETTNDKVLNIVIGRRDAGTVMGTFQGDSGNRRVGTTNAVPGAVITSIEVLAQMLGASRSLTADSYQLWEFR